MDEERGRVGEGKDEGEVASESVVIGVGRVEELGVGNGSGETGVGKET